MDDKNYGINIIRVFIKGEDYNHLYKFYSIEDLVVRVVNNSDVPPVDSIVTEARRDDNIIALNEPWKDVLDKLLLVFDYNKKAEDIIKAN